MSALAKKHDAINLSQGFPNYSSKPILFDLVYKYMAAGQNQYAPLSGTPNLLQAISEKVQKVYNKSIDQQNEICINAGATQAVYTAIQTVIHAGDEAIIFEPAFDIYAPAVKLAGGKVRRIALSYPKFEIDWELVRKMITPNTKLIILNSPNNPTGNLLTENDIHQLEQIANNYDIYFLSDEVYEHLVYDNATHHSILKYDAIYKKSFVTFSFGKTFHNTGWKVGYTIAPKYLMDEFKKIHQFIVFSVNTPVQLALADYINDSNNYSELSTFYQEKRDFFLGQIETSNFSFNPSSGTYFQLLDYSRISNLNDIEFAEQLAKKQGIATIPLSPFYQNSPNQKILRLCFAKTNDILAKAANILCKI